MDDLLNIAGRVALITGGARGIGAATAKLLALHGADIIILDLKRTDESDRTLRAVQQAGRRALLIEADVSQTEKVAQVCREAEKTIGVGRYTGQQRRNRPFQHHGRYYRGGLGRRDRR